MGKDEITFSFLFKVFKCMIVSFLTLLAGSTGAYYLVTREKTFLVPFALHCIMLLLIYLLSASWRFFFDYGVIKDEWIENGEHIIINSNAKLGELHYIKIGEDRKC